MEFKLSKESFSFGKNGGEEILYVQTNVTPTISFDADWCTIKEETTNSDKNRKYTLTVAPNTETFQRSIDIIFAINDNQTQRLNVSQAASEYLFIENKLYSLNSEESYIDIQIKSTKGYSIEIANEAWVKHIETKAIADSTGYVYTEVTNSTEQFFIDVNQMPEDRATSITFTLGDYSEIVEIIQSGKDKPAPDKTGMESDAIELAKKMFLGWNLGNSLEVPKSEIGWGNPKTTKSMIDAVKATGINAVRIPCAWNSYLEDQITYKIKESWLSRVKEVVSYCVDNDMYAIINIHWDEEWLERNCTVDKQDEVARKQSILWTQIATYFRDFDEHLLFAGCNEPDVTNKTGMAVLKVYEQTFIDAVRGTGGKNAYRNLIIQGPLTNIDHTYDFMDMAVDVVPNRLMMEVHYYDPWQFALKEEDGPQRWEKLQYFWGTENQKHAVGEYSERWNEYGNEDFVITQFAKMKSRYSDNNIPVILGEFGATHRKFDDPVLQALHDESIAYFHKYVITQAKNHGLVPFFWDMGYDMSIFERKNNMKTKDFLLNAMIDGAKEGVYPF